MCGVAVLVCCVVVCIRAKEVHAMAGDSDSDGDFIPNPKAAKKLVRTKVVPIFSYPLLFSLTHCSFLCSLTL